MYIYTNKNPNGQFENDCSIRSIATAEGITWDEAYDKLTELAQINRTMPDDAIFIRSYLDVNYPRVPYLPKTVGEVAGMYDNNVVLITMQNHITCSMFGVVHDTFDCRDRVAEDAWIVI